MAENGTDFDVLIVGAGISGIGIAVHLQRECPGKSFAILERRDNIGGTWDLFRYPGIRSDSDMHTLGFVFEPWREQKAIADGPSILNYLRRIRDNYGLSDTIRYGHKVTDARWSSEKARWTLTAELSDGTTREYSANFLYMGAGYYDYDAGHDPVFEGRESFRGEIVHPQFWPQDLDYAGKRIVVIGSGATAVTIVPSVAKKAAHVTMLQRTPTWYITRPAKDRIANFMRRIMPDTWAYAITRWRNVLMQRLLFDRSRGKPEQVKQFLLDQLRGELGDTLEEKHFTPPYNPWEQRLCLVPDGDMWAAMREGQADIVTDQIARFDESGIQLRSGDHIDADIIVTATGLKLAVAGKVAFEVDGEAVDFHDHFFYKGCMFSNIPNMALVFGYLNASWTLKADIVSAYVCRLLKTMDEKGAKIACPQLSEKDAEEAETVFDFSSGYIQRAIDMLPKNGAHAPWRLNQDYYLDRRILLRDPVDDGVLRFEKAGTALPRAENDAADLVAAE